MMPAAEVDTARSELREHVDDLTTIGHHRIELDDGDVRHATTPPLLDQIAAEIAGNSQNAGPNAWASKPPLWLDGSVLLAEVDEHTAGFDGKTRIERVRAWGAYCSSAAPGTVVDAAKQAAVWVDAARNLLHPKPKFRLTGQACPRCQAAKVWDRHDRGAQENYARPALEIDPDRGVCVCRACGAQWLPELWEHLAAVLEQQRHETLAARGWDGRVRARTADERWDRRKATS